MTKINLPDGQLAYAQYGSGKRILLAFHGFGQNKSQFEGWIDILGDEYTIYAFDLFYHGESSRSYSQLSKKDWQLYLQEFLLKENIDRFSVLGYSLGGRFAISSAIQNADKIKEMILIAPDGIFLTIWFKMVTRPITRWLFKYMINHPDRLEKLIQFNSRVRLVNKYVVDFVKKEFGDSENRKRVYVSWNNFKTLGYRKRELIRYLGQSNFNKRIILGSKDYIIKPEKIQPILDRIGGFRADILPLKHHQLIGEPSIELLASKKNNESSTT